MPRPVQSHPLAIFAPLIFLLGFALLEIFGFAWLGGKIGALWTVLLVVLTSVIGITLVRLEGLRHLMLMQAMLARGENPGSEALEVWMLLIAGVFLLIPGFFSDLAGVVLLVPPLRRVAARTIFNRATGRTGSPVEGRGANSSAHSGMYSGSRRRAGRGASDGEIFEGEWREASDRSGSKEGDTLASFKGDTDHERGARDDQGSSR
ncbi:MAG: FxsA family protein [Candidatus Paceibacteria bacterium]